MAHGDGYKKAPHRYEERVCLICLETRLVRKDQPLTKLCKFCGKKGQTYKIKNPSPKHDPNKKGAWNSYHRAKRRCKESPYYTEIEFRFNNFDEWFAELGPRPDGCSVDRIDNQGHYGPGNVRWATHKQQQVNRTPLVCPHCGKVGIENMLRYHFDNCKHAG
jgi:hypothetical protein